MPVVVVVLTPVAPSRWEMPAGTRLTGAQMQHYKAGRVAANVRTRVHPKGELRAQLQGKTRTRSDVPLRAQPVGRKGDAMPAVKNVGPRDFDAAVAGPDPVLVDFSASWCGPCRAMAPALAKFAASRDDLGVVKVDIDEAPDIASRYSVRSVPTLMLFVEGKPVATQAGMMSEGQLARFVDQHRPAGAGKPVEQDPNRPQVDLDW